jgi:hypothetical protein
MPPELRRGSYTTQEQTANHVVQLVSHSSGANDVTISLRYLLTNPRKLEIADPASHLPAIYSRSLVDLIGGLSHASSTYTNAKTWMNCSSWLEP